MQIIVIIFFVIILFIFLLLSLSNGEDQKRIAGKEGELQAKKILNHYLNENGLLLKYYCYGSLKSIEEATNYLHCSRRQLQRILKKLCDEGKMIKEGKGKYRMPDSSGPEGIFLLCRVSSHRQIP